MRVTAGAIIIGDEILTGKTKDTNLQYLIIQLLARGIEIIEARYVKDLEEDIINAANEMRHKYNYVFTSGGIGPTHDDITIASIAKALHRPMIENELVIQLKPDINPKYTILPQGCELISDDPSLIPAIKISNLYLLAGVPSFFERMLNTIIPSLKTGMQMHMASCILYAKESSIAKKLEEIATKYHTECTIGSYPKCDNQGQWFTEIIVRSYNNHSTQHIMSEVKESFLDYIE